MVNPEMMEKFAQFAATSGRATERRILPEHLFYSDQFAQEGVTHFHRTYFSPTMEDAVFDWHTNSKDRIHFTSENGIIKVKDITWSGEDYDQCSWIADFSHEITT